MRQEYDKARDVMRMIHREGQTTLTEEHELFGTRHVMHFDAAGELLQIEIHAYSKDADRWKKREAETIRHSFQADSGRTEVVGHVGWIATETATGATLSEGAKDVRLQEFWIDLIEPPGECQASKSFRLDEVFTLGLSGGLQADALQCGFGLVSERTDLQTFCWEWFNVDGPDHATKLQETGELAIRAGNPGGLWQVTRTEFLTDVSLRVLRFEEGASHEEPAWRVLVKEGSWIDWPALVEGVVTQP